MTSISLFIVALASSSLTSMILATNFCVGSSLLKARTTVAYDPSPILSYFSNDIVNGDPTNALTLTCLSINYNYGRQERYFVAAASGNPINSEGFP